MSKSLMDKINEVKVKTPYRLRTKDCFEIKQMSEDGFDAILNGFRLGYLQGMKAARAEAKKARKP